jgi:undecaprenyl-diphosphatase
MFWFLVIATIPGILAGKFLDDYAEGLFRTSSFMPVLIALALFLMGLILYFADKYGKSNTDYEHMSFKQILIIGIAQAFAVIPGTSRSGVTMSAGRAIGVDRESAAKFSFLLSAPIIGGAAIYQFVFKFDELIVSEINLAFLVGVLTSMIVGFLSIRFLLKYLKTSNFNIFVIYRIAVAIILVMAYGIRNI